VGVEARASDINLRIASGQRGGVWNREASAARCSSSRRGRGNAKNDGCGFGGGVRLLVLCVNHEAAAGGGGWGVDGWDRRLHLSFAPARDSPRRRRGGVLRGWWLQPGRKAESGRRRDCFIGRQYELLITANAVVSGGAIIKGYIPGLCGSWRELC